MGESPLMTEALLDTWQLSMLDFVMNLGETAAAFLGQSQSKDPRGGWKLPTLFCELEDRIQPYMYLKKVSCPLRVGEAN